MRYLGALRGAGLLTSGGETVGRADYDFDGFVRPAGEVNGGGEICMPPAVLKEIFGRQDIRLLADAGQVFSLRFSDRKLAPASDTAHVDLTGDLSMIADWRN